MEMINEADMKNETSPLLKENTKAEAELCKKRASRLSFGVDLIEAALAHLEFLKTVDNHPCLYQGSYLKRAIQRYEQLWLPLAAEYDQEILAAPLDIEWVWHCHVLAPEFYQDDCKNVCGHLIDHKLMRTSERTLALARTKDIWQEKYPQEPFDVCLPTGCRFENISNDFHSQLSYDIELAALRQGTFHYNVSLPHFLDRSYLTNCVFRYKKFLHLKQNTKSIFLVPCYDNDLIWHTHQLFPKIYHQDMNRILGYLLNHDDSTTDRSPGSKLSLAYGKTKILWKNFYCEKYNLPGAMYRGVSSKGLFTNYEPKQIDNNNHVRFNIVLNLVALDRIPKYSSNKKFMLKALYRLLANDVEEECIFQLKGPKTVWENSQHMKIEFDRNKHDFVFFRLFGKKGVIRSHYELICEGKLDIEKLQKAVQPEFGYVFREKVLLEGKENLTVYCNGHFEICGNPYNLHLKQGNFRKIRMPENVEELYEEDLILNSNSSTCTHATCEAAQHSFLNDNNDPVLRCEMLHNASKNISALQVIGGSGMMSVAILIDSSHLPLPTQVSLGFSAVTLSPSHGDRAFLIKDNNGDWAIVIGRWIESSGKESGLQIFIHKCTSGFQQKLMVQYENKDCILRMHHCQMDFRRGSVLFDTETEDIPQYVALTFVIGMLHVLCMPHPENWTPGEAVETDETSHVTNLPFVVASGVNIHTPSNHYRNLKKS